jgi:hypothetical protein
MLRSPEKLLIASLALLIAASATDAQTRRKREREAPAAAALSQPADKRDTLVASPSSSFNNRPYWLALGQCGGIYFRLGNLYTNLAIHARVIKPNRDQDAEFTKKAAAANRTATAYFVGAERFLITDRGVERSAAIMIYDARAGEAGDRLKSIDAALQAAKPCHPLYETCRASFPKACSETLVSATEFSPSAASSPAAHVR